VYTYIYYYPGILD